MDITNILRLVPLELATAVVTALLTIGGMYLLDRTNKRHQAKERQRSQLDTAKVYVAPLERALISLIHRLHEIFEDEGDFLSTKAPDNEYYRYKFRSTVYRLCAVIGWLRPANRALSGIKIENQKAYTKVNQGIEKLQASLAEGNRLAETRLNFLARLWNISFKKLRTKDFEKLSEGIEEIIWDALLDKNANFAYELDEEEQTQLLQKVVAHIKETGQLDELELDSIIKKRQQSIRAISRAESWIYRDWQSAIGDMMLIESRSDELRYEVMGFSKFEDLYIEHTNQACQDNRWLERMIRLFQDLNLTRDDAFDARAQQLRDVCSSAIALVQTFEDVGFGAKKVERAEWQPIQKADHKYNPNFYS